MKHKRFITTVLAVLLLVTGFALLLPNHSRAANEVVTLGYDAGPEVQKGMLVMLKDKDAKVVVPLTTEQAAKMHGVVVSSNDATLTLTSENTDASRQVFVATYGRYNVLVSNQNGVIKSGDYITISSIAGVGMKADASEPVVIGKATENFDGNSNVEGTASVKTGSGKTSQLSLGRVSVDIGIDHNPLQHNSPATTIISWLRSAGQQVGGKPVDIMRVYLALLILVASMLISGSMLYAGIKNSIVSIGRNPLAKKSIIRNLIQLVVAALIIFIIGIFAVYLLLKL